MNKTYRQPGTKYEYDVIPLHCMTMKKEEAAKERHSNPWNGKQSNTVTEDKNGHAATMVSCPFGQQLGFALIHIIARLWPVAQLYY